MISGTVHVVPSLVLFFTEKACFFFFAAWRMLLSVPQVLDMILEEDIGVHASHLVHAYAKWDFVHVLMSSISYATVCFCLKDTYGVFFERWVWMR